MKYVVLSFSDDFDYKSVLNCDLCENNSLPFSCDKCDLLESLELDSNDYQMIVCAMINAINRIACDSVKCEHAKLLEKLFNFMYSSERLL